MMPCRISNDRSFEIGRKFPLPPQLQDSGEQRVFFYASGREAMVALCRAIHIQRSRAVLLPAYVPEGLYAPFALSDWKILLYRVDRDLNPDWGHLEQLLAQHEPQLAVLIHYFGLPKPMRRFCDLCHRHGALVVEDMAHAYLGETEERPLGREGDFILYSLPKMLGLPDGGPIVVRNRQAVGDFAAGRESMLHRFYVMQQLLMLEAVTAGRRIPRPLGGMAQLLLSRLIPLSPYRTLMRYFRRPAPMSRISRFLLRRIDCERFKAKRRALARIYVERLDRSRFEFFPGAELPLNVMMGFPVRVRRRDDLVRHLARRSIAGVCLVNKWNFIPPQEEEAYREAIEVLRGHFLFPVHQRLSARQVERVVEAANSWPGGG